MVIDYVKISVKAGDGGNGAMSFRREKYVAMVDQMVEIVKNAGIVGMGGATFPTHVKISGGIGKVDTVIINGAECEPYITGDHRTMLERPEEIIGGAAYLAKMFGVEKVIIGVEDNKQNGIDAMNRVIMEKKAPVVVESLHCRSTPRAVRNSSARPSPASRCPREACPATSAAPCSTSTPPARSIRPSPRACRW